MVSAKATNHNGHLRVIFDAKAFTTITPNYQQLYLSGSYVYIMIYKLIHPDSVNDPAYTQFEYMLGWYDFNGVWQQYLFTDWDNVANFDNEVYNKTNTAQVGSVNKNEEFIVNLTVDDATYNDLLVFLSIFRAEKVYRIYTNNTYEVVAPMSNSIKYQQRGIRYKFSFDLFVDPNVITTEVIVPPDPNIIPLVCGTGLFDFVVEKGNPLWTFPDGSTSVELRPTRQITAGTVYLKLDDVKDSGLEIKSGNTKENFLGDIKVFKDLTKYLALISCANATGDIKYLDGIKNNLILSNCPRLVGNGDNLEVDRQLTISVNNNITLDISKISIIQRMEFTLTPGVYGILNPTSTLNFVGLQGTGLTINDTDQSVINLNNITEVDGGTLDIRGLERTELSQAAIDGLIAKNWTVRDATVVEVVEVLTDEGVQLTDNGELLTD